MEQHPLRTVLFAPGSEGRKLEKVATFGADMIALDLEDAVAISRKDAARELVRSAVARYEPSTIVGVRVNGAMTGRMEDDIRAVLHPGLDCILIPKVEDAQVLWEVDRLVGDLEHERGISMGSVRLLAVVESAKGLISCERIAQAAPRRLLTLVFGLGDFSVDLGIELTRDAMELLYARSRIVVASRAAGLGPCIDGPYLDLTDLEGLLADSRRSRQLGFHGRVVVYPAQIATVSRAYSEVSPEEIAWARRVVRAFEVAERRGSASIQLEGRFIDQPIYDHARRKLQQYESVSQ